MHSGRAGFWGLFIGWAPFAAWAALPTSTPPAPPSIAPAAAATQPVHARIDHLIRDLSSDDFQAREAAQQQLVLLGDAAEPALRQAASAGDAEVASRADRALRQIDDRRSFGPTLVTLHFRNAPAKQVFEELARQAKFPLWTQPEDLFEQKDIPPVTIDLEHRPFWEAVCTLAKTTGIFPRMDWTPRGPIQFCMEGRNLFTAPAQVLGPMVLVAHSFNRAESLELTQPSSGSRSLSANFTVMFEPKLLRRGGATRRFVKIDEATTAAGDILTDGRQEIDFNHGNGGGLFNFTFGLYCPEMPRGRIRTLRGQLRYNEPVRTEAIEVDFTTGQDLSRAVAGWSYEFTGVGNKGHEWIVTVQFKRGSINDQEWQELVRGLSEGASPQLLDAAGLEFTPKSGSISHLDGAVTREYTYLTTAEEFEWEKERPGLLKPGKPAKLIWNVSVETRAVTVPFELHDLPIP